MHRIGLALSGGGFRATLFHLGMIRFLREANILPDVTQITSVSGGSILAAHLVLHWDRYTGSLEEFDAAAAEVIRFVQLDIRNRVVRRYPLAMPLRALNRLTLRGPHRQLTRTGLLEYHYEQFLYGDTCLFQLPERPRLHILATNLSEGCLCAFTRDGLLMQRRRKGEPFRFERIHTSLATVPMAVTASSAFPGFFPPIELQGEDVGADPGQFGRLAFTDGGVYDNLGVRMFRCMERSWMAREVRLEPDDVTDAGELIRVLRAASESSEDTPLRRLAQMLALPRGGTSSAAASNLDSVDRLLDSLWDVMSYENLAREPAFAHLSPPDPEVGPLIETARTNGSEIEAGEQLWLNRQLVDAAFRQGAGIPCFHSLSPCFDTVLVSDAGRQLKINNARAGGLLATGMRATDIVMNRVWELETDTFSDAPGFVFAPISRIIEQADDPTALHPEVQRMSADIRTDLDRFSPLEISSLTRHGYCVGRSACKSRPDLFGAALPDSAPWDPLAAGEMPARAAVATELKADVPAVAPETEQTRTLQQSARRRLWSTLLDYRDWTSYLYVPLLVPILVVLPYFLVKWYRESQVAQHLIEGIAQSNQDYALIRTLLQEGPPLTEFAGMPIEEVSELSPPIGTGVEVISDTRIGDLRGLQYESEPAPEQRSWLFVYRRMRIRKLEPTADRFSIHFRLPTTKLEVRTTNSRVPAVAQLNRGSANSDGQQQPVLEVAFDLSKVPVDEVVDLPIELMSNEPAHSVVQAATFYVDFDTGLLSYWLLLPEGKRYQNFEMLRYPSAESGLTAPELVAPANMLNTLDGRILAFALLKLEPGFMYECRWEHRD